MRQRSNRYSSCCMYYAAYTAAQQCSRVSSDLEPVVQIPPTNIIIYNIIYSFVAFIMMIHMILYYTKNNHEEHDA